LTVAVIVQARLGSTRLPRKVLKPIVGKPMVTHVLERAAAIPGIDVVACAIPEGDDELAEVVGKTADLTIEGHPTDVLDRYRYASQVADSDIVIRITADCPLIDPVICGQVLELFHKYEADYASNIYPDRTFPQGLDCEVMSFDALQRAAIYATEAYDREHVTPWLHRYKDIKPVALSQRPDRGAMRWTVDYPEDLDFVRALWMSGSPTSQDAVLQLMKDHPEIKPHAVVSGTETIYESKPGETVKLLGDGTILVTHADHAAKIIRTDGSEQTL
jgi:spore coat polysaccharide biosynthesis protein SpsF